MIVIFFSLLYFFKYIHIAFVFFSNEILTILEDHEDDKILKLLTRFELGKDLFYIFCVLFTELLFKNSLSCLFFTFSFPLELLKVWTL